MWSTNTNEELIANLIVEENFLDGTLKFYQIFPKEGFKLRVNSGNIYTDDSNTVVKEYYDTDGGALAPADYDFEVNPIGFEAILI